MLRDKAIELRLATFLAGKKVQRQSIKTNVRLFGAARLVILANMHQGSLIVKSGGKSSVSTTL